MELPYRGSGNVYIEKKEYRFLSLQRNNPTHLNEYK